MAELFGNSKFPKKTPPGWAGTSEEFEARIAELRSAGWDIDTALDIAEGYRDEDGKWKDQS